LARPLATWDRFLILLRKLNVPSAETAGPKRPWHSA
jgi:hypothetical protein